MFKVYCYLSQIYHFCIRVERLVELEHLVFQALVRLKVGNVDFTDCLSVLFYLHGQWVMSLGYEDTDDFLITRMFGRQDNFVSFHSVSRLFAYVSVVEVCLISHQYVVGIDTLQFLRSRVADVHFFGICHVAPLGFPVIPTLDVSVVQVEFLSFQQNESVFCSAEVGTYAVLVRQDV